MISLRNAGLGVLQPIDWRHRLAFKSFLDDWASVDSPSISCHEVQMW